MAKKEIKQIEEKIIKANKEYRNGTPIMTDAEYDALLDQLRVIDPHNHIFDTSVIETVKGKDRVEPLPLPMFSLEKVKTWDEIKSWLSPFDENEEIVIMPKYDGISLLVCTDQEKRKCWTRGDGNDGQLSYDRFSYMNINLPALSSLSCYFDYCWGEAIMKKGVFTKYLESGRYKTARNLVAGQFNADKWYKDIMKDIDLVFYGSSSDKNKDVELKELELTGHVTRFCKIRVGDLMEHCQNKDSFFNDLFMDYGSEYNIDGLVLEVNWGTRRRKMGRLPNGNPRYSVAVKFPEWNDSKETKVTGITWNVGKDGYVTPVINIEPTEICGVTVTNVSGHNAAYICDNHIAENSIIQVRRSGDVIPKHDKTISYDESAYQKMMDNMVICPSCGNVLRWNDSLIELCCTNPECRQKNISKLVFFFSVMGFENLGEPTLSKLYDNGHKTIFDILEIEKDVWVSIRGLGEQSYIDFRKQLDALNKKDIPLAKVLTACNIFGGSFGEKTCQLIFDGVTGSYMDIQYRCKSEPDKFITEISQIKGVGEITAKAFVNAIACYGDNYVYFPSLILRTAKVKAEGRSFSVCFTGVRDKVLEEELKSKGHVIVSGVSKNTDILIVKDENSSSSKMVKARELKIPIFNISNKRKLWEYINSQK